MSGDRTSADETTQLACGGEGFKPVPEVNMTPSSRFLQVELELNTLLRQLTFGEPVRYIYNPVEYAWDTHRCYVEKYCRGGQRILFLGMNPGPFGMAQTGVSTAFRYTRIFKLVGQIIYCAVVYTLAMNAEANPNNNKPCFQLGQCCLTWQHDCSTFLCLFFFNLHASHHFSKTVLVVYSFFF